MTGVQTCALPILEGRISGSISFSGDNYSVLQASQLKKNPPLWTLLNDEGEVVVSGTGFISQFGSMRSGERTFSIELQPTGLWDRSGRVGFRSN